MDIMRTCHRIGCIICIVICVITLILNCSGLKSVSNHFPNRFVQTSKKSVDSTNRWKSGVFLARVIEETNSFHRLMANNTIILVDGDNVRGKTKFCVTKMNLLTDLRAWANYYRQHDSIILYFDHGSKQQAFYFQDYGIAVAFSGRKKADDVISRDVSWIHNHLQKNIVIITEDLELRQRCKRAVAPTRLSKKKEKKAAILLNQNLSSNFNISTRIDTSTEENIFSLYSVSSPSFVGILYNQTEQGLRPVIDSSPFVLSPVEESVRQHDETLSSSVQPENAHVLLDLFRQELSLREQLDSLHRLILRNSGKKKSRRAVADFKRKHRLLTAKLERFYSLNNHTMQSFRAGPQLDASSSSSFSQEDMETLDEHASAEAEEESDNNQESMSSSSDDVMETFFTCDAAEEEMIRRGAALLSRAQMPAHKEETWQRVILAEEMRRDLISLQERRADTKRDYIPHPESPSLLQQYVSYYNSL